MRNHTNEKLSRVKALLVQLQKAATDSNLVAALAEAVLLELGLAYRCFLSELATAHGLAEQAPANATALAASLAERQSCVAEVGELANLERERDWPHTLLAIAEAPAQPTPGRASSKAQDGLINVLQVDEITNNKLNYSSCFEIYQALRTCIEHQRDMAQEW